MPESRVSVVIPAKDEEGLIGEIVDAVKPYADEVLVVDGHSRDRTHQIAIEHGGSISACHGSCREGEVDLVPLELGGGYEVMKKVKRVLDPLNVMNPGKYLLDQGEG